MISVAEARRIMFANVTRTAPEAIALSEAHGRFLCEDVRSPHDHPLFNCSAVDGYAFAFSERTEFKVVAELAAGTCMDRLLGANECARIFTGAMLPPGADTVVMQEFVQRSGDRIQHSDNGSRKGGNVRDQGEQLRKGDALLRKGDQMDAGAIGLSASVGISSLPVARIPRVCVLISGNEFTSPPDPEKGKIFSSNDVMLQAALRAVGVQPKLMHVDDDNAAFAKAWKEAVDDNDLVISTGGVSVGDHDLVLPTLMDHGATIHFHKVAQKPGKPMLFAQLNGIPIIGLPGNPRAVMVLFQEYVLPFVKAMQGSSEPGPATDILPLMKAVAKKGDRAEFRAAHVHQGRVELLADEGSHMLRSLVASNALAFIPAEVMVLDASDPIEVHYLPR